MTAGRMAAGDKHNCEKRPNLGRTLDLPQSVMHPKQG